MVNRSIHRVVLSAASRPVAESGPGWQPFSCMDPNGLNSGVVDRSLDQNMCWLQRIALVTLDRDRKYHIFIFTVIYSHFKLIYPFCRFAARQFTVRLGDNDLSTDREPSAPVTFKVTEVRAHPRFSRVGFYNDIAILVLDRPVRKSKYVIPVCLPKPAILPQTSLAG